MKLHIKKANDKIVSKIAATKFKQFITRNMNGARNQNNNRIKLTYIGG